MKNLSLRLKFILGSVAMVSLFGITALIITWFTISRELIAEHRETGLFIANYIADWSAGYVLTRQYTNLSMQITDYAVENDYIEYIFIMDERHRVVAHTFGDSFPTALKSLQVPFGEERYSSERFRSEKGVIINIVVPILKGQAGYVHLGISERHVTQNVAELISIMILIMLGVLMVGVAVTILATRTLTEPLAKLVEVVTAAGSGNNLQKVQIVSHDEIGRLAAAFNQMVDDLRRTTVSREKYQKQNDFLNDIIESIPYPFCVIDVRDYTLKLANSAATSSRVSLRSQCYNLTRRLDRSCAEEIGSCPLPDVVRDRTPHIVEQTMTMEDGTQKNFEVHGYPIFNLNGEVIQIIEYIIEITDRKRAEMQLKKFSEKLKQSNEELQNFAYIASHDLQEPLRKITAFGERLYGKYFDNLDERGREYMSRMDNAARRMQTLINDLLAYSRVTTKAQPFTRVNLYEIIQGVLSDLEVRIEQTAGTVEIDGMMTIDADPLMMRQLFQNLIGNALKFHRDGVPPRIEISGDKIRKFNGIGPVQNRAGDYFRIRITDNGIGFDEKYSDRIFGIFQRLHGRSAFEGSGVGLAISRKIIERHHGQISVKSTPGEGTEFTILLPVIQKREKGIEETLEETLSDGEEHGPSHLSDRQT